jgi:chromate transport protein ChrA
MRWVGIVAIVAMIVPSAIACVGIIAALKELKLSLEATDKEFVKERKDGDSD